MRWRILRAACSLFVMLVLVPAISHGSTVRIEPSRFIFHLESGERTTGVIEVTNNTGENVELTAVVYDWALDEQDKMITHESGTLKESLDGLLRFNPRHFLLDSGQKQVVRFTLSLPEDAEPFERRGIIFFEHEDPFEGEGVGATVRTMIGSTIYALPAVYELSFELVAGLVHTTEGGDRLGAFWIRNECDVHLRIAPRYKVIDARGRVVEEDTVSERVLLPGNERPIIFPLAGGYSPGSYELLVEFAFVGTGEMMNHGVPFTVESP